MINGLWLGILLGFALITDFTLQKSGPIEMDWTPDVLKPRVEQVVYDRIEYLGPDMYLPISDTIYQIVERPLKKGSR